MTKKETKKELSKKFLKKPKAKGIVGISSEKTLKSFAHDSGPMVREVPPKELVRDDRSLFFTREFEKEERSLGKWVG